MSLLLGPEQHLLGWEVSLLIGPDTTFTRVGSVLTYFPGYYIYDLLGWEIFLLIGPDTIFIRMVSVLLIKTGLDIN